MTFTDHRSATVPAPRGARTLLQHAATAYARGDRYLEVQHPRPLTEGTSSLGARSDTGLHGPLGDLLGALTSIGWELEHVSYLPLEPSATSYPALPEEPGVMCIYLLRAVHRPRPRPRPTFV